MDLMSFDPRFCMSRMGIRPITSPKMVLKYGNHDEISGRASSLRKSSNQTSLQVRTLYVCIHTVYI